MTKAGGRPSPALLAILLLPLALGAALGWRFALPEPEAGGPPVRMVARAPASDADGPRPAEQGPDPALIALAESLGRAPGLAAPPSEPAADAAERERPEASEPDGSAAAEGTGEVAEASPRAEPDPLERHPDEMVLRLRVLEERARELEAAGAPPEAWKRLKLELAEATHQAASQEVTARGAVLGRVVDDRGAGVAGAAVRVLEGTSTPARVETDGAGGFRFDDIGRTSRTALLVTAPGFADRRHPLPGGIPRVPDPDTVLVRLEPGAAIDGLVLGPDGPTAARVEVRHAGGQRAERTGADGRFRIEGLPLGEVSLHASTSQPASARVQVVCDVPGLHDVTIRLGGGSLAVLPGPGREGERIMLWMRAGYREERPALHVDGSVVAAFEGLQPGRYQVSPARNPYRSLDVDLADGEALRVDASGLFEPGVRVEGRVFGSDGAPRARAVAGLFAADGRKVLTLTGDDGRFVLEGLEPAPHVALFRGNDGTVERFDVDLSRAGDRYLEARLLEASVLRGVVIGPDGLPRPHASVRANPIGLEGGFREATTGDDGRFELKDIYGGPYLLRVRTSQGEREDLLDLPAHEAVEVEVRVDG